MTEEVSLRPLRIVILGMLLVVIDIRLDSVDIVPDPLGWLIAATTMASLARHGVEGARSFWGSAAVAGCAVLLSIPDWLGTSHTAVDVVGLLLSATFVFTTCTAIRAASPAHRPTANAIRWLNVGFAAILLTFAVAVDEEDLDDELQVAALVLVGLALAVFVWFLVLLAGASRSKRRLEPPEFEQLEGLEP